MQPIPFVPSPERRREANVTSIVKGLLAYARARNMGEAQAMVREDRGAVALLQRAAVTPHTMSTTTTFTQNVVDATVDILGPDSAAGAVFSGAGVKVTFDNNASVWVPGIAADGAKPSWVAQGNPIRIGQWDSTKGCSLAAGLKLGYGVVVTNEMIANSNSEGIFRRKLAEDVGAQLEASLFGNAAAVANQSPAGLLASVQTVNASTGTVPGDALVADIGALAGAVSATGGPVIYVGNAAEVARIKARLPFMTGVYASGAIAAGSALVAIAVRGICVAGSADGPVIDTAAEATLWMDDAATNQQLTSTGPSYVYPIRNLFQSDCTAIRLIMPDLTWGQRIAAGSGGCVAATTGTLKW
jgi:hypothetical protein